MKTPDSPRSAAQSATSLPQAPRDDEGARFRKYALTMSIRMLCLLGMVLITPYGWYTWVLGAGAVFLPYIAVVLANVGADGRRPAPENPERMLPSAPPQPEEPEPPRVIRISETPRPGAGTQAAPGSDSER